MWFLDMYTNTNAPAMATTRFVAGGVEWILRWKIEKGFPGRNRIFRRGLKNEIERMEIVYLLHAFLIDCHLMALRNACSPLQPKDHYCFKKTVREFPAPELSHPFYFYL
jgi:hypothetical protein